MNLINFENCIIKYRRMLGRNFKIHYLNLDVINLSDKILLFTTNGNIKKNGAAVMGRGIAKYVRDNFEFYNKKENKWLKPDIFLGRKISKFGNIPFVFKSRRRNKTNEVFLSISFPTKNNFWEKSDLKLIENSTIRTIQILNKLKNKNIVKNNTEILIPLIGTENGKLKLNDVEPFLIKLVNAALNLNLVPIVFSRKGTNLRKKKLNM